MRLCRKGVSHVPLQWRHNERDGVLNHQPHECLLNRLSRRRSNETSKLSVTGLCGGNSPVTDEFPSQRATNAENISIWWRHQAFGESTTGYNHPWYKSDLKLSIIFLSLQTASWTPRGPSSSSQVAGRPATSGSSVSASWSPTTARLYTTSSPWTSTTSRLNLWWSVPEASSASLSSRLRARRCDGRWHGSTRQVSILTSWHGNPVRFTGLLWEGSNGQRCTVETLYNTINFCWSTHKRHSIARPKGRGMGCLLWVQRATYCVDLSLLSSMKYLL